MKQPLCAITGATGGIGAALSKLAAEKGFDLILQGRSKTRLEELRKDITTETPGTNIELVTGNFDTSSESLLVAESISKIAPKLNILFNNAGVLLEGVQMSPDGLEMHTQVNLIAPYILMKALKNNVAAGKGTIINVSSGSIFRAKSLSIQALQRPDKAQKLFGAYATSKLALSVITQAMGNDFSSSGISLASADPGPNKTNMTAGDGMPWFLLWLRPIIFSSPELGAGKLFDTYKAVKTNIQPGAFWSKGKTKSLPGFSQSKQIVEELLEFCNTHSGNLINK